MFIGVLTGYVSAQQAVSKDTSVKDTNYELYQVTVAPQILNDYEVKKKIIYPEAMKEAGIQGQVKIKVLVDKEGNVIQHQIKETPHKDLAAACVDVIYDYKFSPGIKSGEKVNVWMLVPFNFKLKGYRKKR